MSCDFFFFPDGDKMTAACPASHQFSGRKKRGEQEANEGSEKLASCLSFKKVSYLFHLIEHSGSHDRKGGEKGE